MNKKKIALGFRPAVPTFTKVIDILTFGKYKGHTVEWVIEHDPDYVLWVHDEKVAKISEGILNMAEEAGDNRRWDDADAGLPGPWELWGDDD